MVKLIEMGPQHKPKSVDFEGILQEGQNPHGFTAETANGTARAGDNPGWNKNFKSASFPAPKDGVWDNANRTGE